MPNIPISSALIFLRRHWLGTIYLIIGLTLNIVIMYWVYRIAYQDFRNSVITLRFNIYEGVTVIENSTQVLGYLGITLGISLLNAGIITFIHIKQYATPKIRQLILHWISITTMITLMLVGYYLMLVMQINL